MHLLHRVIKGYRRAGFLERAPRWSWCNSGVIVYRLWEIDRDKEGRCPKLRTTQIALFLELIHPRWHQMDKLA
jgi:hypothetical protein